MEIPANIFSAIVFDLHPRIKDYIDQLNDAGQIDLDDNGHPFLVRVERQGPNRVCCIARNNRLENFVMNTRRQVDPINSWKEDDGFTRVGGKRVISIELPVDGRKERQKRGTFEDYERLVNQIIRG